METSKNDENIDSCENQRMKTMIFQVGQFSSLLCDSDKAYFPLDRKKNYIPIFSTRKIKNSAHQIKQQNELQSYNKSYPIHPFLKASHTEGCKLQWR